MGGSGGSGLATQKTGVAYDEVVLRVLMAFLLLAVIGFFSSIGVAVAEEVFHGLIARIIGGVVVGLLAVGGIIFYVRTEVPGDYPEE